MKPMNVFTRFRFLGVLALSTLLLTGCERPPPESVQHGYRGTGMLNVYNPRILAEQVPLNQPPVVMPALPDDGPRAKEVFKNLQVLGDLSAGALTRHMASITMWVAPKEGCAYCHNLENLADDSKYTKVVARRMLQMTQTINADWKPHVAETGVTCYTCHRGENIPKAIWFNTPGQDKRADFIGNLNGQNTPAPLAGLSSLPADPLGPYLQQKTEIKVGAPSALPQGHKASIQATEGTYALMFHMSQSLGVNCTYCHNTRNFANWQESTPQRVTAWHGIRMVRDLNDKYLDSLTKVFPAERKGPLGDVGKVNCTTCHQGAYKPLYGAPMAKDFPELLKTVSLVVPASAAPLPAPVAEARRSVLYFDVGSPALKPDQAQGLTRLIDSLKAAPNASARISGFHSAAGTLAQNQELAKQRAMNVRDALKAGGIAESRVTLARPRQTEANVAGEDARARRVEVTIQ
jgi:photosynthetic reaction center cytochrome c subunit